MKVLGQFRDFISVPQQFSSTKGDLFIGGAPTPTEPLWYKEFATYELGGHLVLVRLVPQGDCLMKKKT